MPSRITRNLVHALHDMKSQTRKPDAIYINLPDYSVREKKFYDLKEIEPMLDGVIVLKGVPDDGPITKILPVLDVETDPETRIVVIDDDTRYHSQCIENLEKYSQFDAVGHCARNPTFVGREIKDLPVSWCASEPTKVAFLETVSCVMYKRSCFTTSAEFRKWMKTLPADAKFVDDIMIGAWLHKRGAERWLVPCIGNMWSHDNSAPFALSQTGNLSWRNTFVFNKMHRMGYYSGCAGERLAASWVLPVLITWVVLAGVTLVGGVGLLTAYSITGKKEDGKK
jgi:hypothetical protein